MGRFRQRNLRAPALGPQVQKKKQKRDTLAGDVEQRGEMSTGLRNDAEATSYLCEAVRRPGSRCVRSARGRVVDDGDNKLSTGEDKDKWGVGEGGGTLNIAWNAIVSLACLFVSTPPKQLKGEIFSEA